MTHKIVILKASELVEDFDLYPRNSVFDGHVHDLAEAIRGGAAMPPVVACERTRRISDGLHRRRAHVRVGGPDVEIAVQLVAYENDAAMFRDTMVRNATHGRRLTTADFARCAVLAKKFKITREELAGLLHVTREKLKEVCVTRIAQNQANEQVVLRRPMAHLAGRKLSKAQEEMRPHAGGQSAYYHAHILAGLIESKSLPDDERLADELRRLHAALEKMLVV